MDFKTRGSFSSVVRDSRVIWVVRRNVCLISSLRNSGIVELLLLLFYYFIISLLLLLLLLFYYYYYYYYYYYFI